MANTVAAMWWAANGRSSACMRGEDRAGWAAASHSHWLRLAVVEEAEKEPVALDPGRILAIEPPSEEMSEARKLADLDRLGVALLVELLRPVVGKGSGTGRRSPSLWR